MAVRPRLQARAFQGFVQAVQLILKLTEFRLFDPQSIFRIRYPCLDFSLCTRVSIEPCFYLGEGIFEVLLFRCRSLTAAFLSPVDESACNPKPKSLRQAERILLMSGTTNWRTTAQENAWQKETI
jgi:hypothetical protein